MIRLQNVTKLYARGAALSDVSLTIHPGEFVCLVGSSGAGKSTLLSLILGAEAPTSGTITIDGADLATIPAGALQLFRRRVGVIYQDLKLFPHRTVAENIASPLEIAGASDAAIEKRVAELLKKMKIAECRDAFPRELSSSEKARVAIARGLSNSPLILLADEPTQNLDMRQAVAALQALRELQAAGSTVIVTTRDAALVETLNARVIRMENGKIVEDTVANKKEIATKKKETVVEEALVEQPSLQVAKTQRRVKITAIRSE